VLRASEVAHHVVDRPLHLMLGRTADSLACQREGFRDMSHPLSLKTELPAGEGWCALVTAILRSRMHNCIHLASPFRLPLVQPCSLAACKSASCSWRGSPRALARRPARAKPPNEAVSATDCSEGPCESIRAARSNSPGVIASYARSRALFLLCAPSTAPSCSICERVGGFWAPFGLSRVPELLTPRHAPPLVGVHRLSWRPPPASIRPQNLAAYSHAPTAHHGCTHSP
jgi:hypothetical protein